MEDLHFLERLERIGGAELDRALALYRSPDLVRLVLERAAAPDVERIAIALADRPPGDTPGPWLVVARSGHFVTCLARGMRHELPVVSRATLERLAERHVETRALEAYATELSADGTASRLWSRMVRGGARVSRAQFAALQPLAPLYAHEVFDELLKNTQDVVVAMKAHGNRLLARASRLSARDLEVLDAMWSLLWYLSHAFALLASCPPDQLTELTAPGMGPTFWKLTALVPATVGFTPLLMRTLRFMAAIGKPALPTLKQTLGDPARGYPQSASVSFHLVAIALAHPKVAAEVGKALYLPTPPPPEVSEPSAWSRGLANRWLEAASRLPVRVRPEEVRLEMIARGSAALDDPQISIEAFKKLSAIAASDEVRRLASGYGSRVANHEGIAWYEPTPLRSLAVMGRFIPCADPSELYHEDEYLPALPARDGSHPMLTRVLAQQAELHGLHAAEVKAQSKPQVAKNAPCPCGSGKKHKRCCGA